MRKTTSLNGLYSHDTENDVVFIRVLGGDLTPQIGELFVRWSSLTNNSSIIATIILASDQSPTQFGTYRA